MSDSESSKRTVRARDAESDVGDEEPMPPYIVVRNGDDTDLTVSVSVSAAGEDGPSIDREYRLAGDRERVVTLDGPIGDVLRVGIDAGVGASAQVNLDSSRIRDRPVPQFVVRNGRIAVSGLAEPSERTGDSEREPGLS